MMYDQSFSFQHALTDFDFSKLPIDAALLHSDPGLLARVVQAYYESLFSDLGGTAVVLIKDGVVHVSWRPIAGDPEEAVFTRSLELLARGDYAGAEPLLRALLARRPDHPDTLCNLGMLLSDQGRIDEAIQVLSRLVHAHPSHAKGWTALGVAYARTREEEHALEALRHAADLEPDNPHVLKNLGGLLIKQSPQVALPLLERSVNLLPDDQGVHLGLARCLLQLGQTSAADDILSKIIRMSPLSEIAEQAKIERTNLAARTVRSTAGPGGLRIDAVHYCLDALEKFSLLNEGEARTAVYEIAMLGRGGLDLTDPSSKHSLRSLPGEYSGLHLLCILYTGLKRLNLDASVGLDLAKEYAAARQLFDRPEAE